MPITMDTSGLDAARAGVWIQVHCRRCSRRSTLGPNSYGWQLGERPLRDIVPLLRCRNCQAKGQVRLWLAEGWR